MTDWRYEKGLDELGNGLYAYLQPLQKRCRAGAHSHRDNAGRAGTSGRGEAAFTRSAGDDQRGLSGHAR